jgi:hypothetical protein
MGEPAAEDVTTSAMAGEGTQPGHLRQSTGLVLVVPGSAVVRTGESSVLNREVVLSCKPGHGHVPFAVFVLAKGKEDESKKALRIMIEHPFGDTVQLVAVETLSEEHHRQLDECDRGTWRRASSMESVLSSAVSRMVEATVLKELTQGLLEAVVEWLEVWACTTETVRIELWPSGEEVDPTMAGYGSSSMLLVKHQAVTAPEHCEGTVFALRVGQAVTLLRGAQRAGPVQSHTRISTPGFGRAWPTEHVEGSVYGTPQVDSAVEESGGPSPRNNWKSFYFSTPQTAQGERQGDTPGHQSQQEQGQEPGEALLPGEGPDGEEEDQVTVAVKLTFLMQRREVILRTHGGRGAMDAFLVEVDILLRAAVDHDGHIQCDEVTLGYEGSSVPVEYALQALRDGQVVNATRDTVYLVQGNADAWNPYPKPSPLHSRGPEFFERNNAEARAMRKRERAQRNRGSYTPGGQLEQTPQNSSGQMRRNLGGFTPAMTVGAGPLHSVRAHQRSALPMEPWRRGGPADHTPERSNQFSRPQNELSMKDQIAVTRDFERTVTKLTPLQAEVVTRAAKGDTAGVRQTLDEVSILQNTTLWSLLDKALGGEASTLMVPHLLKENPDLVGRWNVAEPSAKAAIALSPQSLIQWVLEGNGLEVIATANNALMQFKWLVGESPTLAAERLTVLFKTAILLSPPGRVRLMHRHLPERFVETMPAALRPLLWNEVSNLNQQGATHLSLDYSAREDGSMDGEAALYYLQRVANVANIIWQRTQLASGGRLVSLDASEAPQGVRMEEERESQLAMLQPMGQLGSNLPAHQRGFQPRQRSYPPEKEGTGANRMRQRRYIQPQSKEDPRPARQSMVQTTSVTPRKGDMVRTGGPQQWTVEQRKCFRCGVQGHLIANCPNAEIPGRMQAIWGLSEMEDNLDAFESDEQILDELQELGMCDHEGILCAMYNEQLGLPAAETLLRAIAAQGDSRA